MCIWGKLKQCAVVLKATVTCLINVIRESRNWSRYKNRIPKIHNSITKIFAKISLVGNNSSITNSSDMVDFKLIKVFNVTIHPLRALLIKDVIWQPYILDWIKYNCDGAYNHDFSPSGCGGIFRDHSENFVLAFAKQVCWNSFMLIEFCAIMRTMDAVKDKSWSKIWIVIDFLLVVQVLFEAFIGPLEIKQSLENLHGLYCTYQLLHDTPI